MFMNPPQITTELVREETANYIWYRWFKAVGDWMSRPMVPGGPPAAATDPGLPGEVRYDSSYVYVCVADNTWKRAALSTW